MLELNLGVGVWFVIGGYLLLVLVIAVAAYFKKDHDRSKSMQEHYLAGSQLGYFVLFMTIYATYFSG
jgi:Na+/pantothenate symporter